MNTQKKSLGLSNIFIEKRFKTMKNRTKRKICTAIVIVNFFFLLGLTGSCEFGNITVKEYIVKSVIILVCSIIPALKSGIFGNR